jgi:hypothetical protein
MTEVYPMMAWPWSGKKQLRQNWAGQLPHARLQFHHTFKLVVTQIQNN